MSLISPHFFKTVLSSSLFDTGTEVWTIFPILFTSFCKSYKMIFSSSLASLILLSISLTAQISSVHGSFPLDSFFFAATSLLALLYSLLRLSKTNLDFLHSSSFETMLSTTQTSANLFLQDSLMVSGLPPFSALKRFMSSPIN